jgi:hypothetical protein
MTMRTVDDHLAQVSRSPSHSAGSGTAAPLLVATCPLAAFVALVLLGQRAPGPGESPAGADDTGAWIVGP